MVLRKPAARAALFGLVTATVLPATPASACNFLQGLFGACRSEPAPVAAPEPQQTLEAGLPPEKKAVRHAVAAMPRKQIPLAPPDGARVGSFAHFAADPTLRKGDVIVTTDGFLVYRGATGDRGAQAFAPVDPKQTDLANLENASRRAATADQSEPLTTATTALASAAVAKPAKDKSATAKIAHKSVRRTASAAEPIR